MNFKEMDMKEVIVTKDGDAWCVPTIYHPTRAAEIEGEARFRSMYVGIWQPLFYGPGVFAGCAD